MTPATVDKITERLACWLRDQIATVRGTRVVMRGYDRRHDYPAHWSVAHIRAHVLDSISQHRTQVQNTELQDENN